MELLEALKGMGLILYQELHKPTVRYKEVERDWSLQLLRFQQAVNPASRELLAPADMHLHVQRKLRPRPVLEHPEEYLFSSLNFDLLSALYAQVQTCDRPQFIAALAMHIMATSGSVEANAQQKSYYPSWNGHVSDAPLVAEFLIRTNNFDELLEALAQLKAATHSVVLLLMQLEDALALNFTGFSDAQLCKFCEVLRRLRDQIERSTARIPKNASRSSVPPSMTPESREVVRLCNSLYGQCEEARYWYLKGALQGTANLEVNADKAIVEGFLKSLGFSSTMTQALEVAESLYRSSASAFELKSCLGHLRSFLEQLHLQAYFQVAGPQGEQHASTWGKCTSLLRQNGYLTKQQEDLATSLYTLTSDEGVHPLAVEMEYARLIRNMVIEYGLMFLTVFEKKRAGNNLGVAEGELQS